MGEALAGGLLAAGHAAGRVAAADPDPARRYRVEEALGFATNSDIAELVAASDLVVLAVKPGQVE